MTTGLKAKDVVGVTWRVAFALQSDGWCLRSDIIWAKPNPMPESVRDRPTRGHEYLFLLAPSSRYFYDAEAIRQPLKPNGPRSQERRRESPGFLIRLERRVSTTVWEPGYSCEAEPEPAVVLDPFAEAPRFTQTCASCLLTFGDAGLEVREANRLLVNGAQWRNAGRPPW